jgi:hypothetical protein
MEQYRTISIKNEYSDKDIMSAFQILNTAGIHSELDGGNIVLNFDIVDMKYIEYQSKNNRLIGNVINELLKIRSFSSANGKIVFKSFNKAKKVQNKNENKKKRLGYEYYQKNFSKDNNEISEKLVNKIHCANSMDFLKTFPNNCIDLVLTSPPYNFGIAYNNTNDVNIWEDYFGRLEVSRL